jgi:hypothetical protein
MANLSFAKDIRPMFTDIDVAHMKAAHLDLSDHESVAQLADAIYKTVSEGTMPPPGTGEKWTPEMCARFKQWKDEGCPP